jgi:hypothetical protein
MDYIVGEGEWEEILGEVLDTTITFIFEVGNAVVIPVVSTILVTPQCSP